VELRRLAKTDFDVSAVALGCWPIAGMTSRGVTDDESIATVRACFDSGVNFLDTAYCYGRNGESEDLIRRALKGRRDEIVIATKGGIHWGDDGNQVLDSSPERLRQECEESLRRLGTDRVELYYVHAPDKHTPIAETAGGMKELLDSGKIRAAGVSNYRLDQLQQFAAVCPLSAYQPPFNMLQRDIEKDTLPWCVENDVSVCIYWPLLKGLLAGKLSRDTRFPPDDSRSRYPMYQGEEWEKNLDFVDRLREVATDAGKTVAQVVINWTIHQPGITVALCGAKRPEQIEETAGGAGWRLTNTQLAAIDEALAQRGPAQTRLPV